MRACHLFLLAVASACATSGQAGRPDPLILSLSKDALPAELPEPALPRDSPPVYIHGAVVMTAAGQIYNPGYLLLRAGIIEDVGPGDAPAPLVVSLPKDAAIDGHGLFVTPGIIDTHSHMGVYALPWSAANEDGNEATSPTTPELWAEHSFWPGDPAIWRAVAGGVTTVQVLPGSANLIGGRAFVAHLRPRPSAREMRFPGALQGVKMACGENPKRVYAERHTAPTTRMGNAAGFRAAFQRADEYRRKWQRYERDLAEWRRSFDKLRMSGARAAAPNPPEPPERNLGAETLAKVLDGTLAPQIHCYRADDMSVMLDIAQEFGFHIRSFHHALEAYKIRDRLAREGVAVSTWTDWGGFKLEAFDGIPQAPAMLTRAGVRVAIKSDSEVEVRHLNQEAAKAQAAGHKDGIDISDDEALRWITANPAWVLGIDRAVGTLEKGKRADVVLWNRSPFSVYARPVQVFIDGDRVYDARRPRPVSDYELGRGENGEEAP